MGRTLKGMVAALGLLGALQAPMAEASGWFHPLRAVEHVASDVGRFGKRVGTDVIGGVAYETSSTQLVNSLGLLCFGVGVLTANPILIAAGVGLNSATTIGLVVHAVQYDRATHGKDPGFSIGPIHIPSGLALDSAGANVGRNAATRSAAGYVPVAPSGPNVGFHH